MYQQEGEHTCSLKASGDILICLPSGDVSGGSGLLCTGAQLGHCTAHQGPFTQTWTCLASSPELDSAQPKQRRRRSRALWGSAYVSTGLPRGEMRVFVRSMAVFSASEGLLNSLALRQSCCSHPTSCVFSLRRRARPGKCQLWGAFSWPLLTRTDQRC